MSAMATQITGVPMVCSTFFSGADQRKHQSSASLAFVREIHRLPVNSPRRGPITRKMFLFDDVIMQNTKSCAYLKACTILVWVVVTVFYGIHIKHFRMSFDKFHDIQPINWRYTYRYSCIIYPCIDLNVFLRFHIFFFNLYTLILAYLIPHIFDRRN